MMITGNSANCYVRNRLVFEDTMADPRAFRAKREGGGICRIEAGEVQGIAVGSVFE